MGTPLPPTKDGDPCTTCWGPAKPFGDVPTPAIAQVRLTAFLPGVFATAANQQQLLVTHWLEQTPSPCIWEITASGFLWRLVYSAQFTNLLVERVSDGKRAFVDDLPPSCELDITNALIVPDDNVAFSGFANITFV